MWTSRNISNRLVELTTAITFRGLIAHTLHGRCHYGLIQYVNKLFVIHRPDISICLSYLVCLFSLSVEGMWLVSTLSQSPLTLCTLSEGQFSGHVRVINLLDMFIVV